MSFVLMEDLRKPMPKRRFAFITSIRLNRLYRPIFKWARTTYRGSRFLIKKAVWVIRGDRPDQPAQEEHAREVENNR